MSKIPETFNIGSREDLDVDKLLGLIEAMYTDLAVAINKKPDVYERDTPGKTTDTFLSNGDININTTTKVVQMLTSHTSPTAVTWKSL